MSRRVLSVALTLVVAALAGLAAWALYRRYLSLPWTRDCQVRANVVGIAPRIAGSIIEVAVKDNQKVAKGDLLFVIDPAEYQAQVAVADAAVLTAQANLTQREQEFSRQQALFERKVNTTAEFQTAQDALVAGRAQVASAKANLSLAQLNLGYTRITAPLDGLVTSMTISPGTFVNVGERLTALVDSNSFWIAAYFKETQLPAIKVGQKARVTLLRFHGAPMEGVVESIGWGIYLDDGSPRSPQLLPTVSQTVDWVRLPQRFPVRIRVSGSDPTLRIGETASVTMLAGTAP